jgi:hypothetical protein
MWNDFAICCGTFSGADETRSLFCVNDFLFARYYELSVVSQPYRAQDWCKFKIVEKWEQNLTDFMASPALVFGSFAMF